MRLALNTSSVCAFLFVVLLSLPVAFGKSLPWKFLPGAHVLWGALYLAALSLLLLPNKTDRVREQVLRFAERSFWPRVFVLWTAALFILAWIQFRAIARYTPPLLAVIIGLSASFWLTRATPLKSMVINLAFLIAAIFHSPLDPHRSDMLPAISMSLDAWSAGDTLYRYHDFGEWRAIPHYLPWVHFSQWPAWSLGIDLRWNTVLYRILAFTLIWRKLLTTTESITPSQKSLFYFLVLNPYWNYRHELYFEFYLLLIALFWIRPKWRWFVFPAMVFTRNFAWILAPFVAIREWRASSNRGRWLAMAILGVVTTAGATIALIGTQGFRDLVSTLAFFAGYAAQKGYPGDYGLTLSPALFALGKPQAGFYLQALLGLAFVVAALRCRMHPYAAAVGAFAAFFGFNLMYWNYFWYSSLWWAALGLILCPREWETRA